MSHTGGNFFTSLMALLFVAFIGLAIASYSIGWLTVDRHPQQTTIHIDTRAMESAATTAADGAQREGRELLQETGETLRHSGEALEESTKPATDDNT